MIVKGVPDVRIDQLILNVKIYNSYYKVFEEGSVAVCDGRFLYIGPRGEKMFTANEIVDGRGHYMIPGLIDIHLHIESTMVTPATFSYGLLRCGSQRLYLNRMRWRMYSALRV